MRRSGNQALGRELQARLLADSSGYSQIVQNGQTLQLAPGEMLLMDSVGSIEIIPFGLIEHASLSLSRPQVCSRARWM